MKDFLVRLFGYETGGGRSSTLWSLPFLTAHESGQSAKIRNEEFGAWSESKRRFNEDELVEGSWIKVGDHGQSFVVEFSPGGTFTERSLFDPSESWEGSWTLKERSVRLQFGNYELVMVANGAESIHSAIECDSGEESFNYFKIIHVV